LVSPSKNIVWGVIEVQPLVEEQVPDKNRGSENNSGRYACKAKTLALAFRGRPVRLSGTINQQPTILAALSADT
jgi:hypothetical protein